VSSETGKLEYAVGIGGIGANKNSEERREEAQRRKKRLSEIIENRRRRSKVEHQRDRGCSVCRCPVEGENEQEENPEG
jgi:hypothetical protein